MTIAKKIEQCQNYIKMNSHMKVKLQKFERHRSREQINGHQERSGVEGRNWEIGIDTYILLIVCIK